MKAPHTPRVGIKIKTTYEPAILNFGLEIQRSQKTTTWSGQLLITASLLVPPLVR